MEEYRDCRGMEEQRGLYYRNSGRCDYSRLLVAWVIGFLILIPGALLYAILQRYIPFVIINAAVALGYAAGAGLLAGVLLMGARNRNKAVSILTGLLVGAAALWLAWGFWLVYLVPDMKLFSADTLHAMRPSVLFEAMRLVLPQEGYLTFKSASINGWSLIILWSVEALAIVGGSVLVAVKSFNDLAFCERCGEWTNTCFVSRHLSSYFNHDEMTSQLEQHDLSGLGALEEVTTDSRYTLVEIQKCNCGDMFLLAVIEAWVSVDDKGNESENRNKVIENLYISEEEAQAIANHFKPAY